MTVPPVVERFVEGWQHLHHLDSVGLPVAERRARIRAHSDVNFVRHGEPGPDVADISDHVVEVDGGEITLRLYRPAGEIDPPVHVLLHGGGWWLGSIDEQVVDATCRWRATDARVAVASVGYRLAPEHPFPTGLDDVLAAVAWITRHARPLRVDATRLSIGGASAGANLAVATSLLAAARGGPHIGFQLLEVPALDLRRWAEVPSASTGGGAGSQADEDLTEAVGHYLTRRSLAADPLVSPLLARDLSVLPPTHVVVAEHDILRPDGEHLVARLRDAGVPATIRTVSGATHSAGYLTGVWEPARQWRQHADGVLADALQRDRCDTAADRAARPSLDPAGAEEPRHVA